MCCRAGQTLRDQSGKTLGGDGRRRTKIGWVVVVAGVVVEGDAAGVGWAAVTASGASRCEFGTVALPRCGVCSRHWGHVGAA